MKKILKYQCFDLAKALVVYYLVIILIITLAIVGLNVTGGTERSGIGFSSEFFCLIVGLCMFREYFYLFMQNGVSRKKIFAGACMCLVILSAVMSAMDVLALYILEALPAANVSYMTISSTLYSGLCEQCRSCFASVGGAGDFLPCHVRLLVVGYLISICFYRSPQTREDRHRSGSSSPGGRRHACAHGRFPGGFCQADVLLPLYHGIFRHFQRQSFHRDGDVDSPLPGHHRPQLPGRERRSDLSSHKYTQKALRQVKAGGLLCGLIFYSKFL